MSAVLMERTVSREALESELAEQIAVRDRALADLAALDHEAADLRGQLAKAIDDGVSDAESEAAGKLSALPLRRERRQAKLTEAEGAVTEAEARLADRRRAEYVEKRLREHAEAVAAVNRFDATLTETYDRLCSLVTARADARDSADGIGKDLAGRGAPVAVPGLLFTILRPHFDARRREAGHGAAEILLPLIVAARRSDF